MYYVIEDKEDKYDRYIILITNYRDIIIEWSGRWYTCLSEWKSISTSIDDSSNETIDDWLKEMPSCKVLLKHPSLTAEILRTEYPELLI